MNKKNDTEDIFPSRTPKSIGAGAPTGNQNAKKKEPRNRDINLKVSDAELQLYTKKAKRSRITRNEWIRKCCDRCIKLDKVKVKGKM